MNVGILSSSAAGSTVITVTVGADGVPNYGFFTSAFGSVSPTTLYGNTIGSIYCNPAPLVQIHVIGIVTATFFNRVTFKYGASAVNALTLTSAAATFSTGGGNSTWQWAATTTFTVTDNGLARFVIFYR